MGSLLQNTVFGRSKKIHDPSAFISTWKTDNISDGSSSNTQIKLPLSEFGIYNFNVDWGDETSSVITTYSAFHTYAIAGTYTITITGICKGWSFLYSSDNLKLLSIQRWGSLQLGIESLIEGYFYSCRNLTLSNVEDVLKTSGFNTLKYMFSYCVSLTTINRVNEWDVSNIETMIGTFEQSNFNQNIGNWNVSKVIQGWNFISSITPEIFAPENLDAIYNGWSLRPVQPSLYMSFGTAKYTQAGSAGRAILTEPPNNWTINDGGLI